VWGDAKRLCPERAARLPAERILVSGLLVYHFDLLIDYLAGEAVDGHVHPVMLLPFHDEVVSKILRIWLSSAIPGIGRTS
jgi:hypothetical protein